MKKKNNQQNILNNYSGSREEVEIHEQRIKEYRQKNKKKLKNRIMVFSALLITVLAMGIYVIKYINGKEEK
ncbi:hypothetical protein QI037_10470 [Staphylococcus saprophyticus]|uniref:Uncharacterized protein n=1 Tax=Staphylococcus cohnii TaxID=29382 RepID=A0ABT6J3A9_9STAP|nr:MULTISPECIES: hypothetical protein [Staphylococcus]MDH5141157.1 hypothetical protein [Staphylococcus cohnii]MDH5159242.1 hypothetical protein [Staphylococcus cohnii]MDH5170727.1 hypothetical protein [Staphylococcus cohnii]MDW3800423.1 hypothetical protein [Staphylococcus saprophyticus]MDW3802989.1 hypothetical protein [Staphylococcus saprophyticus]